MFFVGALFYTLRFPCSIHAKVPLIAFAASFVFSLLCEDHGAKPTSALSPVLFARQQAGRWAPHVPAQPGSLLFTAVVLVSSLLHWVLVAAPVGDEGPKPDEKPEQSTPPPKVRQVRPFGEEATAFGTVVWSLPEMVNHYR